jgi:hypothetical protein
MPANNLDLAKVLAPILVALIFGVITAYIAWRQYQVAHSRLTFDLFQDRYRIYERIWRICADAMGPQKLLLSDRYQGHRSPFDNFWPKASLLFGSDVDAFIQQVALNWMTLSSLEHEAKKNVEVLENSERRQLYYWFQDQVPSELRKRFMPYLDLSRVR